MDNMLPNGAVLPFGLLSQNAHDSMAGFNKAYKNYPLRVGVVVQAYPVSSEGNRSKLMPEYDVIVLEQHEDKGATSITYRNCMSSEGLGSIADYFEKTLRKKEKKTIKSDSTDLKGQDGAIVLLMCLDGMSDKGIIISALTHPDRKTTLVDEGPRLEGEFNGVNVKVEKDGSTTLTFRGATNNDGSVVDNTQGNTVLSIDKEGSFQVQHKTVTQLFKKDGNASLTADDNITNTTKKDFVVGADGNVNLTATKDFNLKVNQIAMNAQGSAVINSQSFGVNAQSEIKLSGSQFSVEAQSMAKITAATITLDGVVALGGAGGQPVLLLSTMFIGIGNLGAPVISQAIAGFATKVTAT